MSSKTHSAARTAVSLVTDLIERRAAVVFFMWALWLSLEYLVLGPFSYVRIPENANIHIPARLALAHDLSVHNLGFWVPEFASGVDRLSELMACDFDALLFLIFPGWLAHGLFMLLQRFIAGYFCFRLMKDEMGLGNLPALYAGLAYTLLSHEVFGGASDSFTLYDGLVVPGVPLVLWFLGRLRLDQYRTFAFAFIAGLGFAFVGGFPISLFALPLIVAWFAFVSARRTVGFWARVLVFFAGWLVGTSPFIWATGLNAANSHRSAGLTTVWAPNLLLVLMVIRDNALSLLLAVWGLWATRGKERRLRTISVMVGAFFGFLLFSPFLYRAIRSLLGFVSGFNFDRFYIYIPFLIVVCGALGLQVIARTWRMVDDESDTVPIPAQGLLAVAAVMLLIWQSVLLKQETLWEMKSGSNFAAIFQRPDILQLRERTLSDAPFRVASVGDHPSFAWAYGLETVDGYLSLYPRRYQQYWGAVLAPVLAETPGLSQLSSGNLIHLFIPEALRSSQYGLPASNQIRFDEYYNLNLLSLANVRFVISSVPLQATRLKLLPSSFRDKQVPWTEATKSGAFLGMLRGAPPGPPVYIYENDEVLPRFFLTGNARTLPTASETLAALSAADNRSLRSTAFVTQEDASGADLSQVSGEGGKVSLVDYSADKIELATDAASANILVMTNGYNRYWKATIDGSPSMVFPADYAFQGLAVPAGHHRVILRYLPPYARGD